MRRRGRMSAIARGQKFRIRASRMRSYGFLLLPPQNAIRSTMRDSPFLLEDTRSRARAVDRFVSTRSVRDCDRGSIAITLCLFRRDPSRCKLRI